MKLAVETVRDGRDTVSLRRSYHETLRIGAAGLIWMGMALVGIGFISRWSIAVAAILAAATVAATILADAMPPRTE